MLQRAIASNIFNRPYVLAASISLVTISALNCSSDIDSFLIYTVIAEAPLGKY